MQHIGSVNLLFNIKQFFEPQFTKSSLYKSSYLVFGSFFGHSQNISRLFKHPHFYLNNVFHNRDNKSGLTLTCNKLPQPRGTYQSSSQITPLYFDLWTQQPKLLHFTTGTGLIALSITRIEVAYQKNDNRVKLLEVKLVEKGRFCYS